MKNMKVLILVFAVVGILGLFIPIEGMGAMFSSLIKAPAELVQVLLIFGLPAAMGAMALAKPPMMAWQAGAAAAGFGFGFVKMKMWTLLPHIMDLPLPFKLMIVGVVGGLVVSILALIKPEAKA